MQCKMGSKQSLNMLVSKHGQNKSQSQKEKRKSLIDIISAIQWFQSYKWLKNRKSMVIHLQRIVVYSKKSLGLQEHVALWATKPSESENQDETCTPSYSETLQLLFEELIRKETKVFALLNFWAQCSLFNVAVKK